MSPSSMKCCAACLGDPHLRKKIDDAGNAKGDCDYCGTKDVILVAPSLLHDEFELLVSLYPDDPSGQPFVQRLQEDWLLFADLERATAKELLVEILNDGEAARRLCGTPPHAGAGALAQWQKFRNELMYVNRFFPSIDFSDPSEESSGALATDRIRELLSYLFFVMPTDDEFHRARLQVSETPYALSQMGAPPKRASTHGRANPAGIPYLYLASNAETAISEVRPHPGEIACVATFNLKKNLKVVDLRSPRRTVSPFQLGDEELIVQLRRDLAFLDAVSEELMRPVVPRSAAIDYVPTQYICELIKSAGFDGVVYRSSVGKGYNLALFDPENATPQEVSQSLVRSVTVEVASILNALSP